MTNSLPYHIRKGDLVLSLKFLNPHSEEIEAVERDLVTSVQSDVEVHTEIQVFDFDEEIYALYSAEEHSRPFPTGWSADLSDGDIALADLVIDTFRGILERWEEQNDPLKWYKEPNPLKIVDALNEVNWRQTVPEVGGEIISYLIQRHCLPNANHRTAVGVLRAYLQSIDNSASFQPAGNYNGEWHEWAENYVYESKKLLMLRRKPDLLQYAKQFGCDEVERKGGISLELDEYDFQSRDIKSEATDMHRQESIEFVTTYLKETSQAHLTGQMDPGKRVFVSRL